MEIKVSLDKKLLRFVNMGNLNNKIEFALMQAGNIIRNAAKINSPILTGTLRRSITSDLQQLRQGIVIVGSPVKYAQIREFINNKNPSKRFYFRNAYEEGQDRITELFNDALASAFN